ncbi:Uncharacterised protein [Actinomyces bovis]|uniref:Uncharacterized protein n=1 Tax=Actinomyces bovis TaxID=1658 RepID=A0ABY1VPQ9_9ACTO|nr:hypothetical protein [Actinomyces bovis]SPT53427.1 Uncharacterised protein [Actinomyces bovis]VEG52878.1 Uncharacterised protein [Actinomyces israelii]
MRRRILSEILALIGLVVIALAVCSATIWKPSSTAVASLTSTPTSAYVVTRPGVLGVADPDVTITATAADASQPVTIAIARSADVKAWLGSDPYEAVTDLDGWTKLVSKSILTSCDAAGTADTGQCTPLTATGANPASSDLWQRTATGTGTATLKFSATDPDLVALVATDGTAPAPKLSLSWPRTVSTPWLIPGLILGGLLLLFGVFGFVLDLQLRHQDEERRARAAERAAHLATADGISTAAIPQVGKQDRVLSRREQREKERVEAQGADWIDPRSGEVQPGGAEVPPIPLPTTAQLPQVDFEPTLEQIRTHTGLAHGTAVVPGLAEATVAAHRATRELPEGPAFETTPEEAPVEAAPAPAVQVTPQAPVAAAPAAPLAPAAVPSTPAKPLPPAPIIPEGTTVAEDLVVAPVIEPMISASSADLTDTSRIPVISDDPYGLKAEQSTVDVHDLHEAAASESHKGFDTEQLSRDELAQIFGEFPGRHAANPNQENA